MNSASALLASALLAAFCLQCRATLKYPGMEPGPAHASVAKNGLLISNRLFSAQWTISERGLRAVLFRDAQSGRSLMLTGEVFQVVLKDGHGFLASELRSTGAPTVTELKPQPASSRLAGRIAGREIEVNLASEDGRLGVTWRALF